MTHFCAGVSLAALWQSLFRAATSAAIEWSLAIMKGRNTPTAYLLFGYFLLTRQYAILALFADIAIQP
jgi:hypothetical protein